MNGKEPWIGSRFPDGASGIGTQKNPIWICFGWEILFRLRFYLTQQFVSHYGTRTYLWEPSRVASTTPPWAFMSRCDALTLPSTGKHHSGDTYLSTRHPGSLGDLSFAVVMLLARGLNTQLHAFSLGRCQKRKPNPRQQWREACRFPVGSSIKKDWLISLPYFLIYSCWTLPCASRLRRRYLTDWEMLIQRTRPPHAIKVAAPRYICMILNQNNSVSWEFNSSYDFEISWGSDCYYL